MIKKVTISGIGFGAHADDVITVTSFYTPSNVFEFARCEVWKAFDDKTAVDSTSVYDAIRSALSDDIETAEWIEWMIKHI